MSNRFFVLVGLLFLTMGILAILNAFNNNIQNILWFCYIGLILIGIGILKRDSYIIHSQLNILLIPLIFWTLDFLYLFMTGNSLFGITNYFFQQGEILPRIITLQHLFTIPLSLYILKRTKLRRDDAWKFSLIQIGIFFILTRILTEPELNINCVFNSCVNILGFSNLYTLIWITVVSIGIFLTNFLIVKLYFKSK